VPREFHVDDQIRRERESHALDRAIAVIAARQHGVISREQLLQLGLTPRQIRMRIHAGRLHPVHRGVYAVGHRRLSREGRYLGAVLASGEGAVLSHRAAADLWELRRSNEREIDVIASTHRRGDPRLRLHAHAISRHETTRRLGIPVTKPLRTLLDLAAVVKDVTQLERAIRQAVYRKLTTTTLLADAVQQRPGQRGTKRLRKALANIGEAPGLTRSPLEETFLRFLRKHRLPLPELNVRIRGIEVDCLWRDRRVIAELDGRDAHHQLPAFESDRARDSALLAAGWPVIRITSARIRNDGQQLANELRAILG
jgi:very-short-patch-repair endonuclease